MEFTDRESKRIIHLPGRIDAENASAAEQELNELAAVEGKQIELDAGQLEYISSAGLRILMNLKRRLESLRIVEVSQEVYEILDVTGFTALLDVQKRLRELSVDGCPMIGRGGNGEVYRLDAETILKLYNEGASLDKIAAEKKYATEAFAAGLPCAISYDTVKVGTRYGIVFELLHAKTVGELVMSDPASIPRLGREMGELMRQLHGTAMPEGRLPRMTDKVLGWIDYIEEKNMGKDDADLMRKVALSIPEKDTLLHCDFHEGNVMIQGEELLLIDLDDICTGNPVYDLSAHYTGHVIGAKAAPESIRKSMGMDVKTAMAMYRNTMEAYLGTQDLSSYEQAMQLFSLFSMLVYLGKGKDSSNMNAQRAAGLMEQVLPKFRQLAPVIMQTVQKI